MLAVALLLLSACADEQRSYLPPPPRTVTGQAEQPPLPASVTKLRIGLVPITNPEALERSWSKLIDYLSKRLGVPCEVVMGSDYDDAGKKLEAGEVDLVAFSPYAYVRAGRRLPLRPLVTVVADGSQTAGAYILVRFDSKRQTFDDLKGATFGYVDKASTSGYLYPVKLMLDRGWDPTTAFSRTDFYGNHEAVLLAVHDGKVEAGATYFGALKALKEHRGIDPLSFRVVAKTERTPHDVLAMRLDADERIGKAVSAALLRLTVRDDEGRELLTPLDMNGFYPAEEKLYDRVRTVSEEVEAKVGMIAPLMVTVSSSGAPALVARARRKATDWALPYFERGKNHGIKRHLGVDAEAFLVLGDDGWRLTAANGALGFTPNLAQLRLKRFDAGERDDVMLKLAELREGDAVLDCTLGLGADALVAARAVGPKGRVLGLEKSLPLSCLMAEGLADWTWPGCAKIEVVQADFRDWLARAEPKSFDVVMFDPMFERETGASPAFELLRRYAYPDALDREVLARAREIARRWVLVKAARFSPALKRLELEPEVGSRSAPVVWARLKP